MASQTNTPKQVAVNHTYNAILLSNLFNRTGTILISIDGLGYCILPGTEEYDIVKAFIQDRATVYISNNLLVMEEAPLQEPGINAPGYFI